MTNAQFIYQNKKPGKWLLSVILLASIFTFSGHVGNYQSRPQATQTELLLSNHHKTYNWTISAKKAFECMGFNTHFNSPGRNWESELFAYNTIVKVKLDNISKQFTSHTSADRLLLVKILPQSTDEDDFVTFKG